MTEQWREHKVVNNKLDTITNKTYLQMKYKRYNWNRVRTPTATTKSKISKSLDVAAVFIKGFPNLMAYISSWFLDDARSLGILETFSFKATEYEVFHIFCNIRTKCEGGMGLELMLSRCVLFMFCLYWYILLTFA